MCGSTISSRSGRRSAYAIAEADAAALFDDNTANLALAAAVATYMMIAADLTESAIQAATLANNGERVLLIERPARQCRCCAAGCEPKGSRRSAHCRGGANCAIVRTCPGLSPCRAVRSDRTARTLQQHVDRRLRPRVCAAPRLLYRPQNCGSWMRRFGNCSWRPAGDTDFWSRATAGRDCSIMMLLTKPPASPASSRMGSFLPRRAPSEGEPAIRRQGLRIWFWGR
jgi:hypothetical protein